MKPAVTLDNFVAHFLAHLARFKQAPVELCLHLQRRDSDGFASRIFGDHREIAGDRVAIFFGRQILGHDLDADNLALLRAARISAVLHHDLRSDARSACQHIMRAHGV